MSIAKKDKKFWITIKYKYRDKPKCPICGYKDYRYVSYSEECFGIVEQHGYCERCGYIVEQAYSEVVGGLELDRTRGYRNAYTGEYLSNNKRKRRRMRRKYHIKHTNKDWWLSMI